MLAGAGQRGVGTETSSGVERGDVVGADERHHPSHVGVEQRQHVVDAALPAGPSP